MRIHFSETIPILRSTYYGCNINKENNVFKDALGVKGLGFKLHGNHACNHGSHDGNHHGNYHAEQLLFSRQCSKVSVFV